LIHFAETRLLSDVDVIKNTFDEHNRAVAMRKVGQAHSRGFETGVASPMFALSHGVFPPHESIPNSGNSNNQFRLFRIFL